ncbi:MAG: hypothetical protein FWE37_01860 [Spirochaetaceae bacterium]|nr:hypothetical protein [Spirochaetaceae bacterium]
MNDEYLDKRYDETPLDDEERELAAMIERGELDPRDDRSIIVKVKVDDLNKIKDKAAQLDISYLTLIRSLLHRYATEQIKMDNYF